MMRIWTTAPVRAFRGMMKILVTACVLAAASTAYQIPLSRPALPPAQMPLLRSHRRLGPAGHLVAAPSRQGVSLRAKEGEKDLESMYRTVTLVMDDVVKKVDERERMPPAVGASEAVKKPVATVTAFFASMRAFIIKWWQELVTMVMAWWLKIAAATEKLWKAAADRFGFEDEAVKLEREQRELEERLAEEERLRKEEQRRINQERWDFAVGLLQFGAKKAVEGAQSTASTVSETAQKMAPAMIAVGAAAAAADLTDVAVASVAGVAVATAVVDLAVNEKRREKGLPPMEPPAKKEKEVAAAADDEAQDKLSQMVAQRKATSTLEKAPAEEQTGEQTEEASAPVEASAAEEREEEGGVAAAETMPAEPAETAATADSSKDTQSKAA